MIIMVVIGILWVPIIQNMQGGQLYIYIQSVAAYFSPSIGAVYLLAVLWKGINEKVSLTIKFRIELELLLPKIGCFLGSLDRHIDRRGSYDTRFCLHRAAVW